jgi:hypothetical protein
LAMGCPLTAKPGGCTLWIIEGKMLTQFLHRSYVCYDTNHYIERSYKVLDEEVDRRW